VCKTGRIPHKNFFSTVFGWFQSYTSVQVRHTNQYVGEYNANLSRIPEEHPSPPPFPSQNLQKRFPYACTYVHVSTGCMDVFRCISLNPLENLFGAVFRQKSFLQSFLVDFRCKHMTPRRTLHPRFTHLSTLVLHRLTAIHTCCIRQCHARGGLTI
jgi:hypothetical protein